MTGVSALYEPHADDARVLDVVLMTFGKSEPGDTTPYFVVATQRTSPLGVPEYYTSLGAIHVPEAGQAIPDIALAMRAIIADVTANQGEIVIASLTYEAVGVRMDDTRDEADRKHIRALAAERRLRDHPAMSRATFLYAAHRDGRRWHGVHYLQGQHAGEVEGPELFAPGEHAVIERRPLYDIVRRAVGISWRPPAGE